jgi:flagellar hook-length control protein FliK
MISEKEKTPLNLQELKGNLDRKQFVLSTFTHSTSVTEVSSSQAGVPNANGMPLNPIHQFVLHVGENRSAQQNGENILRQFNNILGKSSLIQYPNGINKLTIKLFPQHLGRLDVTLIQQNGVIVAQLMTTTKAAKSAIESQLHQLRQAFIAQNLHVEKIEVQTQHQQLLNQSDKENKEGKNTHEQKKEQNEQDGGEEKFEDVLRNETFDIEV